MKKLLSIALLAFVSFSPIHLFAQKYHDAMTFFGVKGNVKKILEEEKQGTDGKFKMSGYATFNEEGEIEWDEDKNRIRDFWGNNLTHYLQVLGRDEEGFLECCRIDGGDLIHFYYNGKGVKTGEFHESSFLGSFNYFSIEYVLNSNGIPLKVINKGKNGAITTKEYSDYKFDFRGNWIMRKETVKYSADRIVTHLYRRTITYWDNKNSSSSSSVTYSSSAGGTYTIQKGDVLWNVSKKLLKESGKANPTNGEIMQAMKDIAKANGCKTYDECNNKYFNSRNVGKSVKLPGYLSKTTTSSTSSSSSSNKTTTTTTTPSSSSSSSTTTTPSSTTTTTPSTSSSSTYSSGSTYGGTSSRPSYNYSYKKYREPHKWVGFSIGYVQKSWASKIDGKKERYGMWEDSKFVNGVQAGIRVEPVTSFGLGLNTGLFYEYYYTESDDMYYTNGPGSYRGVIQEHALYLPVHLEYRLRFSDDFSAFIYGGAGFDYGISAGVEFKDTDDDYVVYENNSLYESEDVENWKRFNASLEYGLGLSYKNVQLNVTRSHGLVNMAKEDGYSVKQNKPLMVSLSIMF